MMIRVIEEIGARCQEQRDRIMEDVNEEMKR